MSFAGTRRSHSGEDSAEKTNGEIILIKSTGRMSGASTTPRAGLSRQPGHRTVAAWRWWEGARVSVSNVGKGHLLHHQRQPESGTNETAVANLPLVSKLAWGANNRIAFGALEPRTGGGFNSLGVAVTGTIPATSLHGKSPRPTTSSRVRTRTTGDPAWSDTTSTSLAFTSTRDSPDGHRLLRYTYRTPAALTRTT